MPAGGTAKLWTALVLVELVLVSEGTSTDTRTLGLGSVGKGECNGRSSTDEPDVNTLAVVTLARSNELAARSGEAVLEYVNDGVAGVDRGRGRKGDSRVDGPIDHDGRRDPSRPVVAVNVVVGGSEDTGERADGAHVVGPLPSSFTGCLVGEPSEAAAAAASVVSGVMIPPTSAATWP